MLLHVLKILHLLGLTLFLGSVCGHIGAATTWLTLPGLALLVLSGLGMMWLRYKTHPPRWLQVHAVLAGLVVLLAAAVIVPVMSRTLLLAQNAGANAANVVQAKRTEDIAGAVNVLLTLITLSLGVIRPQGCRG